MRTAAAGMFLRKLRKFAVDQRLHSISNCLEVPAEIYLNPRLVKSRERSKTHAAGDQFLSAFICQILDRHHAPALFMGSAGDYINTFYFVIFHSNECIKVTVAKMRAQWRVKSTRFRRRNCY